MVDMVVVMVQDREYQSEECILKSRKNVLLKNVALFTWDESAADDLCWALRSCVLLSASSAADIPNS